MHHAHRPDAGMTGASRTKLLRSGKRLGSERQILHEPHIVAGTHSMPLLKEKERHVHRTPGAAAPCTGRVAGACFLRKQKLFEQGRYASAVKRGFLAIYRLAQAIDPGNPSSGCNFPLTGGGGLPPCAASVFYICGCAGVSPSAASAE